MSQVSPVAASLPVERIGGVFGAARTANSGRPALPWRMHLGSIALAALAACAPAEDAAYRPNFALITLDTTRADHLGAYGYFRDTSPRFDAFAAEAILFERMVVPVATTLPSHLSILTSSHPLEHGVLANVSHGGRRFVPAPELVSFASVARQAGYATGAFVSAAPLARGSGIEVGFDHFDQPRQRERRGEETAGAAIAWLESLAEEQPFLLWVHFYDAHFPFDPPPPYRGRFRYDDALEAFITERGIQPTAARELVEAVDDARTTTNDYDAELLYQDFQLGRVLDALRAHGKDTWERTAVVVVGDHGEGLCQHGEAAHGGTWGEQLHAPLAMRIPGEEPRRVDTLLTSADVLPSLLQRLGVADFHPFLDKALGRDALDPDFHVAPILSQDTGRNRDAPFKYALTDETHKYFRVETPDGSVDEWLFDLGADPYELRDVSSANPERVESMRERTLALVAERSARGTLLRGENVETVGEEVSPRLRRELCELGYLAPESCVERAPVPRPAGGNGP